MPVYMIANLRLRNPVGYEEYKAKISAVIVRHGGEYLVRGGSGEIMEGQWQPHRLILLRFPNRAALQAFYDDPEYAPLKALRRRVADADIVVLDGIA